MDETRLAQDVLSLLDKIMVGIVAIVAGVIAQWLSHNWSKEREQERILREKAEALVTEMYKLLDWALSLFDPVSLGNNLVIKKPPPMLPRLFALWRLYFPSLEKEQMALMDSWTHFAEYAQDSSSNVQRMGQLYDKLVDTVTDCSEAIHDHMVKR